MTTTFDVNIKAKGGVRVGKSPRKLMKKLAWCARVGSNQSNAFLNLCSSNLLSSFRKVPRNNVRAWKTLTLKGAFWIFDNDAESTWISCLIENLPPRWAHAMTRQRCVFRKKSERKESITCEYISFHVMFVLPTNYCIRAWNQMSLRLVKVSQTSFVIVSNN